MRIPPHTERTDRIIDRREQVSASIEAHDLIRHHQFRRALKVLLRGIAAELQKAFKTPTDP